MQIFAINPERLWGELMETAAIGAIAIGGIRRLTRPSWTARCATGSRRARKAFGCHVTVDDMGAMFARRDGTANVPPIAFGSHLDTQPTGGKFDGVLGVLAALEALRTLHESGYETYAPIGRSTAQRGGLALRPRHGRLGVFAKVFERDWVLARQDRTGMTFGAALTRTRLPRRGKVRAASAVAFFELHIEQGPILKSEKKEIGVVTGVQAMRWYEVTITGQDAHTGTTPMPLRRNALLGAAR